MPADQDAGAGLECAFMVFKAVLIITGIPKFISCGLAIGCSLAAMALGAMNLSEQVRHGLPDMSPDGILTLIGLAQKLIVSLLVGLLIGGVYGMVVIILGLRGSCTRNLNYLGLYIHFSIVYLIAIGTVFTFFSRIRNLSREYPPAHRYASYDSESPYSSYESNDFVNHESQTNNPDDDEGNNRVNNKIGDGLFDSMNIEEFIAEKVYTYGGYMIYCFILIFLICGCIDVFVLPPYIYLLYRWKQKEESL